MSTKKWWPDLTFPPLNLYNFPRQNLKHLEKPTLKIQRRSTPKLRVVSLHGIKLRVVDQGKKND